MAFNFGNITNATVANSTSYLKPYQIYSDVEIKKTEIVEGEKDGRHWKRLDIVFGNNEGEYTESMFYCDENNPRDITRPEYDQPNGGKRYGAAPIEELQNEIASIGFAFFPKQFEKLQAAASKIGTVEQLMALFKKCIDSNIGKVKTNMKLVGRKSSDGHVYARLPKFTGMAEAKTQESASRNGVEVGQWYSWRVSPFNDNPDRLTFSSYEMQQANSLASAKPTQMSPLDSLDSVESVPASTVKPSEDEDLSDLLAAL
jgi:hypothetical protein